MSAPGPGPTAAADGGGLALAIVGMAVRVPGADSVDAFWEVLTEGRETTTWFSDDELLAAGVGRSDLDDPRYVKAGQPVAEPYAFDAELFGMPGEEAALTDPQHRLFLECALTALEDAGCDPATHDGVIGVFGGVGLNTYLLHELAERHRDGTELERYRLMIGNDKDFLATRVAYRLDLRGPAVTVGTACSTGLVAVHSAGLSLLAGECDVAVAGAAHVTFPQGRGYTHHDGMIHSPDGHCRAFDAKAQGTVLGNGAGVVVLKRLADAVADGDVVHAVLRGSAVSNDGARKTGYTAPSVEGQARAVAEAQSVAEVSPASVSYIEAHGTGTPMGDPIELAALDEAFTGADLAVGAVGIGSVKTNIGHLDTAAGIAGLVKTVLMLRHGHLVPSLHFETPNPEIAFGEGPFRVVTESSPWRAGGTPRRAGVSSFGIGGTNAHIVLEEAPEPPARSVADRPRLLLLSAHTRQALDTLAERLGRHLNDHPELDLGDVAHTLATGRAARRHRRALVGADVMDVALSLALRDGDVCHDGVVTDDGTGLTLVLADRLGPDGPVHAALRDRVPRYAEHATAAAAAAGVDVDDVFTTDDETAAFVGQWALVRTLTDLGLRADEVVGTGAGERVAAAVAGDCPLERAAHAPPPAGPSRSAPTAGHRTVRLRPSARPLGRDGADAGDDLAAPDDPSGADETLLLSLLAGLWTAGAWIDGDADRRPGESPRRVSLPTTPLARTRHRLHDPAERGAATGTSVTAQDEGALHRELAAAPEHDRAALLRRRVSDEIARVRRADSDPDPDANLFEMGLESLILIEVAARLGTALAADVAPAAFVEYPTIRSFSRHLAELLGLAPETAPTAPSSESADPSGGLVRRSRRAARAAQSRG